MSLYWSCCRTVALFVFVASSFAGCGDDGEPEDFCTCTDRVSGTMFGFGESCYDGCNWTECATGNTTSRFCEDAGPAEDLGVCTPPDEVEISCEPLPADSTEEGCSGRAYGGTPVPGGDEDTVYPIGCEVRYPECLAAFPNNVATCFCTEGVTPTWTCPL